MDPIKLTPFLEDLESRIDAVEEERLETEWKAFCALNCQDPFFSPRRRPIPPHIEWPKVLINDAFKDRTLMLYTQLKGVSDMLAGEPGLLLSVRANYGTGIIPSMFGAKMFYLADELDTLPCTRPLTDGVEALRSVLDGEADFTKGLVPDVFAFGEQWQETVRSYPLIRRYISVYNPDLQGPFPLVDILAGSDIYYALYEEPEFVHEALQYMTDVYLSFTEHWQKLCPTFDEEHSIEWGLLHKGKTILRNDAIVNLSDEMYREFAMPYDQKVFSRLGGGMHFCGRGDHYIRSACSIENLSCINMSQPELNDMETIYSASIDQGIIIIGMAPSEIKRAGEEGRHLRGRVQSGAALAAYRT